jgi:hypothetical protein
MPQPDNLDFTFGPHYLKGESSPVTILLSPAQVKYIAQNWPCENILTFPPQKCFQMAVQTIWDQCFDDNYSI